MTSSNQRPTCLLIQRKQLGDTVLLEPALGELARRHGAPVGLLSRDAFAPMVSLMENVVPVSLRDRPRAVTELISLETKPASALRALLTPARHKRLIVARQRQLTFPYRMIYRTEARAVRNRDGYRAKHFFRQVAGGDVALFRPPRLRPPPAEWRPPAAPDDYLLIHPTSAWRRKCWDTRQWIETCRALLDSSGRRIILTSGPADWEIAYCETIVGGVGDARVIGMAGATSLQQYLALLAGAAAVLTVDGSASHLAAAFGRPTLTLFGPTNPVQWHLPTPTSVRLWAGDYVDEELPAARHIPVEAVLGRAVALLAAGAGPAD